MKRFGWDVSCIYAIVNLTNGKRYIGSTVHFWNRLKMHRQQLRIGTHFNRHLQSAWNKYGEDSFVFGIIEEVDSAQMSAKEQAYLDAARPDVYNVGLVASHPTRGLKASPERIAQMRGSKHRPDTISVMSQSARQRHSEQAAGFKAFTPEQKQRWYEAMRPIWAKKTFSEMAKARRHTPEAIAKTVAFHTGRKRSEETKAKLRFAWALRRINSRPHAA